MKMEFTEEELPKISRKILDTVSSKTLCFYGPMGAGKTTLIKALVHTLGGADAASSPTFGLVNEYHNTKGKLLGYHFDFYRIESEMEALDMGLEDYFYEDVWIFIEWPEKVPNLLPDVHTKIFIKEIGERLRALSIESS
ncbi:MAG: tRNA (adenosine(37)-N6)-threonylcarbamoyltransferase complex ATPase subunit type 1 TsaE [Flavobacteriaceae bacterium]